MKTQGIDRFFANVIPNTAWSMRADLGVRKAVAMALTEDQLKQESDKGSIHFMDRLLYATSQRTKSWLVGHGDSVKAG